jgi:hypothetical protein
MFAKGMNSKFVVLLSLLFSHGGNLLCSMVTKLSFPSFVFMLNILYWIFNLHGFLKHLNLGAQGDILKNAWYLQIRKILWEV